MQMGNPRQNSSFFSVFYVLSNVVWATVGDRRGSRDAHIAYDPTHETVVEGRS